MNSVRRIARRRRLNREKSEKRTRLLVSIILTLLLSSVALLGGMLWNAWHHHQEALSWIPASPETHQPTHQTTHFYARDGEHLLASRTITAETTPTWRNLNEYPEPLSRAIQWLTGSVDQPESPTPWLAFAWQILYGSLWKELPPALGISGRLAREQLLPPTLIPDSTERTLEWAIEYQLRRQFSADQLLEWYLNRVRFDEAIIGFDAAAVAHFGIPASELNAQQSIQLAWLAIQIPNPANGKDYDSLLTAQYELGHLNDSELNQARLDGPPLPLAAKAFISSDYGDFIRLAEDQAAQILTSHGYNANDAFATGLAIVTTLDMAFQREAEQALSNLLSHADANSYDSAALVSINTEDGSISSMVGAASQVDVPPAPLLLPFLYLESMRGKSTLPSHAATMLLDIPTIYPHPEISDLQVAARNADDQFHGPILLADALKELRAIPAYEAVAGDQGLSNALQVAGRMGWSSLADEAPNHSILTDGGAVSVLDTAFAYASFAARGVMHGMPSAMVKNLDRPHDPLAILEIKDATGNILWRFDPQDEANKTPILDLALADLMNTLLREEELVLLNGTSGPSATEHSGAWALAYSPKRVIALHLHREDDANFTFAESEAITTIQSIRSLAESYGADSVWPENDQLLERAVCVRSGGLANGICTERPLPFLPGIIPLQRDRHWQKIATNRKNGLLASEDTPAERIQERIVFSPPAAALDWWLSNKLEIAPVVMDTATTATAPLRLKSFPNQPQRGRIEVAGWIEISGLSALELSVGVGPTASEWQSIESFEVQPDRVSPDLPITLGVWDTSNHNGDYTIRARAIYDDGKIATEMVRITLDNQPPQFSISSQMQTEASLQILVFSTEQNEIGRIEYSLAGRPLGIQSSPPFGFVLPLTNLNETTLHAVAYDHAGNSSEQTLILRP